MYFTYSLCGWEGAASDVCVFADAKAHDFIVPPGRYYLADAGFLGIYINYSPDTSMAPLSQMVMYSTLRV
jgi:hypothetical protein